MPEDKVAITQIGTLQHEPIMEDTFFWVIKIVQLLSNLKKEINVILSVWQVQLH